MKILFIASNPGGHESLRIAQEITELQRINVPGTDQTLDIKFLPALAFEELEDQISLHKPDVIHIVAHGDPGQVYLANSQETLVHLTTETLRTLLAASPPKLLFINACNSSEISREITDTVPFAIGMTAEISNFTARKTAVNLYRALANGRSVQAAFASCRTIVAAMNEEVDIELHHSAGASTDIVMFEPARLIAHFAEHDFRPSEDGTFEIMVGVAGCPQTTVRLVVSTDDEDLVKDEQFTMAASGRSRSGEFWLKQSLLGVSGDFRLFAMVIMSDGRHLSVSATLCAALSAFYDAYHKVAGNAETVKELALLLDAVGKNNGARMRFVQSGLKPRHSQ